MELIHLELEKAAQLKKEVDQICIIYERDINTQQTSKNDKVRFINALNQRIEELGDFYVQNSNDDRAMLFENQRLRLRKLVLSYHQQYGSFLGGNNATSSARSTNSSVTSHQRSSATPVSRREAVPRQQMEPKVVVTDNKPALTMNATGDDLNRTAFTTSRRPGAGNQKQKRGSIYEKNQKKIYDWEDETKVAKDQLERGLLNVDGVWFRPAKYTGFYCREDSEDPSSSAQLNGKFVDLQIILTQEELAVLAARKRASKADSKIDKNLAASKTMVGATPYVDPVRIQQELLRPT